MAGSVNKVILIGNLGRDPEVRSFPNGGKVVNLRLATSERWRDKQHRREQGADRVALGRDLQREPRADRRAVPAQGLDGLHRGPARDAEVAGPVGPGPLLDRGRAAAVPRRADAPRRARRGRGRRRRLRPGPRRELRRRRRRQWRGRRRTRPGGGDRRRDPVLRAVSADPAPRTSSMTRGNARNSAISMADLVARGTPSRLASAPGPRSLSVAGPGPADPGMERPLTAGGGGATCSRDVLRARDPAARALRRLVRPPRLGAACPPAGAARAGGRRRDAAHRADRRGQDARRLPAEPDRARGGAGAGAAHDLRLAAEGARRRHRAEPAGAARRRWGSRSGSRTGPATPARRSGRGSGSIRRTSC